MEYQSAPQRNDLLIYTDPNESLEENGSVVARVRVEIVWLQGDSSPTRMWQWLRKPTHVMRLYTHAHKQAHVSRWNLNQLSGCGYCTVVIQDATPEGDWVKSACKLSVGFSTASYDSKIVGR